MGIQINVGDHTSPVTGWEPVRAPFLEALRWARERAKQVASHMPSADRYFMQLPQHRSLRALLADSSIWINYDPLFRGYGAQSVQFPNEIAMGQLAFAQGRWMVLGTLLHELAHVNGAPGGSSQSAEQTLVHCGLGRASEITNGDDPRTPFMPDISG
jgi:hypothetical protein